MTRGTRRDAMGRCDMFGWLTRSQLRKRRFYYRLQGPFLSEHDDEGAKVLRTRNSIRIEQRGKKKRLILNSPAVDVIDSWYIALNAASKRTFNEHYNLRSMRMKMTTGLLFVAEDVRSGKNVLVKVINKSTQTPESIQNLQRELRVSMTLYHPNILNTLDVFDAGDRLYIVLEHIETARTVASECAGFQGGIPEWAVARIMEGILEALAFLHGLNVIHGDLSLETTLITGSIQDENWKIKLVDPGYGSILDPESKYQNQTVKDYDTGESSWFYIAPEQLRKEQSESIDVWMAGICMYYMTFGTFPFKAEELTEILQKIRFRPLTYPEDSSQTSSSAARALLQLLLEKDHMRRCSVKTALRHPWISAADDRPKNWGNRARKRIPRSSTMPLKKGRAAEVNELHDELSTLRLESSTDSKRTHDSKRTAESRCSTALSDPLNMLMVTRRESLGQLAPKHLEPFEEELVDDDEEEDDPRNMANHAMRTESLRDDVPQPMVRVRSSQNGPGYSRLSNTRPSQHLTTPPQARPSPPRPPSRGPRPRASLQIQRIAEEEAHADGDGDSTPKILKWNRFPTDDKGAPIAPNEMPRVELYAEAVKREHSERQSPSVHSDDRLHPRFGSDRESQLGGTSTRLHDFKMNDRMSMPEQDLTSMTSIKRAVSLRGSHMQPSTIVEFELDPYENRWFNN